VLPIDGRPVIATLLRELVAAGVTSVTVVTGHLAEQVEGLLGDGAGLGLELAYVRQPSPDGSADVVRRALASGVQPPLLVVAADTVFAAGDLRRFAETFSTAGAVAAVRDDAAPARLEVEGGRVTRIRGAVGSPLAAAPLWGLSAGVVPYLDDLDGPPFELAQAFQRAIDAGETIAAIEIGNIRDLTDPLDLVRENFPYLG
jgi:NDP-sugar pyrophosphorylase family protein